VNELFYILDIVFYIDTEMIKRIPRNYTMKI